jgi:hypothetical protein
MLTSYVVFLKRNFYDKSRSLPKYEPDVSICFSHGTYNGKGTWDAALSTGLFVAAIERG